MGSPRSEKGLKDSFFLQYKKFKNLILAFFVYLWNNFQSTLFVRFRIYIYFRFYNFVCWIVFIFVSNIRNQGICT